MKPIKAVVYFLIFYIFLLLLDWLKGTIFLEHYHSLVIQVKTITLVAGGILVMKLTLPSKKPFNKFIAIYAGLWLLYFLLKVIAHYGGTGSIGSKALEQYLIYTQLLTPLPFFVYWVILKVYEHTEPGESLESR